MENEDIAVNLSQTLVSLIDMQLALFEIYVCVYLSERRVVFQCAACQLVQIPVLLFRLDSVQLTCSLSNSTPTLGTKSLFFVLANTDTEYRIGASLV